MALLLDELAEPFDPISPEFARAMLAQHWGIDASTLERLDTERDDTYRAVTPRGDVVLKIAHPLDPPPVVQMQLEAMEHVRLADPAIPLQRIVPTADGAASVVVGGRIARVLTWLEGDLVDDAPRDPRLYADAGHLLGRLSVALADFDHPGAERDLAWDVAHLPDLLPFASDPVHVELIVQFAAETSPSLAALPHQVIHNDCHPANLLVDPIDALRVGGILDFGDAVRSARVCDVAVALAYLIPDAPRPWPDADAFLAGFERVVPLSADERALLPMLVAGRTIMRTVINQRLYRERDEEIDAFYARNDRRLRHILTEGF